MTLSFNKLNEIAALYESIADSEQEQLNEIGGIGGQKALDRARSNMAAEKQSNSKLDAARTQRFGSGGSPSANKDSSGNTTKSAAPSKYKSSSDGKMYANYNDAKAARDSRLKDLAAKQQASRGTGTGGNGGGGNPPPAATTPKVLPTKPAAATPAKPAMGTTAGGTKFERRAATGAELRAAQDARKAGKGEEGAIKAGVEASKPSTLKSATDAASKPSAFKPATTAVASSTTDKGVVPATNAIAAKPKPVTPNPSATSTKPGDGKPYKDGPLWDSYQYDAYDLVLEYLLSQGHAETVAEAHYLMTEMDAEMIGDIVEGSISSRASNAVGHQRAGTLGDDDEIRKNQDATSVSIGKMKRGSGAKVTPTLPGV